MTSANTITVRLNALAGNDGAKKLYCLLNVKDGRPGATSSILLPCYLFSTRAHAGRQLEGMQKGAGALVT